MKPFRVVVAVMMMMMMTMMVVLSSAYYCEYYFYYDYDDERHFAFEHVSIPESHLSTWAMPMVKGVEKTQPTNVLGVYEYVPSM